MNPLEWLVILDNAGPSFLELTATLLWQSALLLSAAWILTIMLRHRSASVRHAVWMIALFCVPLIPLLNWSVTEMGVPKAPLEVLSVIESSSLSEIEIPSGEDNVYRASDVVSSPQQALPPISKNVRPHVRLFYPWAYLLIAYLIGAAFFLGVILAGRLRIRRLLRKGSVVTDPVILETFAQAMSKLNLRKHVRLVETPDITTPFTVNTFFPVILLPAQYSELFTKDELAAVAFHELAHVQRRDPFSLMLVSIIRAVFFFNPLVWLAAHQVSLLAELSCDDRVVEFSGEPVAYAKTLARLAEKITAREFTSELAAGIIISRSAFFQRVESILSDRRARIKKLSRLALAGTIFIGAVSLAVALSFPLGNADNVKTAEKKQKKDYWLEGTVVDPNGLPISGAHFYVHWNEPGQGHPPRVKGAKTDSKGRFLIEGIPLKMVLEDFLRHDSYGSYKFPYLETNRSYTFVLKKPEGSVSGRVIDEKGKPVKGVDVSADGPSIGPSGFAHVMVRTDRKGRFHLKNLENEIHTIHAGHRKYGQGIARNVPVKAENITIVLTRQWETILSYQLQSNAYVDKKKGAVSRGKPAPEIAISQWLTGTPNSLESLRGKIVMLFFWNSQAWDSVRPLVLLDSWQKKYADRGIACIAIHPYTTDLQTVHPILKERAGTVTVAIDRESSDPEAQGETFDRYGVLVNAYQNLPKILIIDREGKIVYRGPHGFFNASYFNPADVERGIEEAIASAAPPVQVATASADTSEDKMITVSGAVTFQGKPVSGADIYRTTDTSSYYGTYSKSTQKMTRTGKDGSFLFKTPLLPKNPLGGGIYVIASHPDYSFGGKAIQGDADVAQLSIKVTRPLTISGKVQDKNGAPIGGAEVQLISIVILSKTSGKKPSPGEYTPANANPGLGGIIEVFDLEPDILGTKVVTNQDGKFAIHGIPESSESHVKVTAKEYAKTEKGKIEAGADDVNFVLVQEGRISGRLTFTDTQKPAENVSVLARGIGDAGGGASKTDKNGRFEITGLTPGVYSLFSIFHSSMLTERLDDYAPVKKENISVEPGKTANVDLQFTHGGIVTGTVTDKDTGEPITGWGVGMTDAVPSFTDSKGIFRFRVAPGKNTVYAYLNAKKGYIVRMEQERPDKNVEVKEGETISGIDFQFSKGIEIHGTVKTPDGKPVEGVRILKESFSPGGTRAVSDSLGHFTLGSLANGENIKVFAEKPDMQMEATVEIVVDAAKELTIVLQRFKTGKIEGRVIGADGKPAAGVEISLLRNVRQMGTDALSSVVAHSDKDGQFKIEKLDMGELYIGERYQLLAQNGQAKSEYFVLTENMRPIELVLPKADSWLEGTVADSDGNPAVGVRVIVNGGRSGFKDAWTDAKGHYRLDGLIGETERVFLNSETYGFSQFKNISLNQKHDFTVSKKER